MFRNLRNWNVWVIGQVGEVHSRRWESPNRIYLSEPNVSPTSTERMLHPITAGGVLSFNNEFYLLAAAARGHIGWSRCRFDDKLLRDVEECPRLPQHTWYSIRLSSSDFQQSSISYGPRLQDFSLVGKVTHASSIYGYILIKLNRDVVTDRTGLVHGVFLNVAREVREAPDGKFKIASSVPLGRSRKLAIKTLSSTYFFTRTRKSLPQTRMYCAESDGRHYSPHIYLMKPRELPHEEDSGAWVCKTYGNHLVGYIIGDQYLSPVSATSDIIIMPLAGPVEWDIGLQLKFANGQTLKTEYEAQAQRLRQQHEIVM
ncbi:hypothetical protein F4810DRAFT_710603 [Camillea tinctor]|nr:hypothetical protein F4810DRAFT_710603 [Camillea tinctor]